MRWIKLYTSLFVVIFTVKRALNAAARLVFFSVTRSEHTTPLLRELHWLKVPERIHFRPCVLTHRCLHGTAPPYLAEMLHRTADVASRRRLRSAATSTLVLPLTRRSTFSDHAFPVAASRAWNSLPASVRDIQSLPAFCQKLKLTLFSDSFAS